MEEKMKRIIMNVIIMLGFMVGLYGNGSPNPISRTLESNGDVRVRWRQVERTITHNGNQYDFLEYRVYRNNLRQQPVIRIITTTLFDDRGYTLNSLTYLSSKCCL